MKLLNTHRKFSFLIMLLVIVQSNHCFFAIDEAMLNRTLSNMARPVGGMVVTMVGGLVAYRTVNTTNTFSINTNHATQSQTNTINVNANPTRLDWAKFAFGTIFSSIFVPFGIYLFLNPNKVIN